MFDAGVRLQVVAYAALALTVVRIVPVMIALHGTTISRVEAVFIGWMGPRGLASLVFGLLAVIALKGDPSSLAAQVMVITVLMSVVAHGLSAGPIAAAFGRRARASLPWRRPRTSPRAMHELERLSAPALADLLERGVGTAVVPFGSIEHQGAHLPLGADAILADHVGRAVAAALMACWSRRYGSATPSRTCG